MKMLIAAVLLAVPGLVWAQDAWDARVSSVKGQVTVFTSEEPNGAPAIAGIPLEANDRIQTGPDGRAELSFDGDGVVAVEANTDLTVASLDHRQSELSLTLGSFIAKFKTFALGSQMRVRTTSAVAAVRGTEFGVEVQGADTHVGVFDEGKVAVSGQQGGEELVTANHETSVRAGQKPQPSSALKRFQTRRAALASVRRRHAALRRTWKALPKEKRQELRRAIHQRMSQRHHDSRAGRVSGGFHDGSGGSGQPQHPDESKGGGKRMQLRQKPRPERKH